MGLMAEIGPISITRPNPHRIGGDLDGQMLDVLAVVFRRRLPLDAHAQGLVGVVAQVGAQFGVAVDRLIVELDDRVAGFEGGIGLRGRRRRAAPRGVLGRAS